MTDRHALATHLPLLLAGALAWGCAGTTASLRPEAEPTAPAEAAAEPENREPPARAAEAEARPEAAEPAAADARGAEPAPDAPAEARVDWTELRGRIVEAARALVGQRPRLDCSGFVLATYRRAGVALALSPLASRSVAMQMDGRAVTTPEPGDLAFFRDTYDRNRNGKVDDGITHVALVESVEGSTVTLLHRARHKVERFRMDLEHPSDRKLNDPVRVRRAHDSADVRYLSGELFVAFGALLDQPVTQILQARRPADTGENDTAKRWHAKRARVSRSDPAPSRSKKRRTTSPSRSVACSGSCPPTRPSSSPSAASAAPGGPSSPAR